MLDTYGENYFLVGPYFPDKARLDFRPIREPEECALSATLASLRSQGYEVHFGYWLLEDSRPFVILINPYIDGDKLNEVKDKLWCHHQISTIVQDDLVDQILGFGEGVRLFLSEYISRTDVNRDVIAHYHEWLSASSIPELVREKVRLATIFTAHATVLGRYLAPNETHYLDKLSTFDWQAKSQQYGVESKATIERAAARNTNVLIANSDVTAQECTVFFERSCDAIIHNGVNRKPGAPHMAFVEHQKSKAKIDSFVKAFFAPSYPVQAEKMLYFFISGRYEYRNKGFDVTLEAAARLNGMLMQTNSDLNVVLFVISCQPFHHIKSEVLEARKRFQDLNKICKEISSRLGPKFYSKITGTAHNHRMPDLNEMVDEELMVQWRQALTNFKRKDLPPISTHELLTDDEITRFAVRAGLDNSAENKVKIVYHPDFIDRTTSLFGMDYLEFVQGCNLGIFPSLYEPWGNAAMESSLQGTPAIVSNTSGFGQFVEANLPHYEDHALHMIDRRAQSDEDAVMRLTQILYMFTQNFRDDQFIPRTVLPNHFLDFFRWSGVSQRYLESYKLALHRNQPVASLY